MKPQGFVVKVLGNALSSCCLRTTKFVASASIVARLYQRNALGSARLYGVNGFGHGHVGPETIDTPLQPQTENLFEPHVISHLGDDEAVDILAP